MSQTSLAGRRDFGEASRRVPAPPPQLSPRKFLADGFCLLVPAIVAFDVNIIGRLLAAEIVLLGLFPFIFVLYGRRLRNRGALTVIALCLAWFGSQVLTDLIRNTPLQDLARGWAKIIFTTINFCSLYIVIDNRPHRMRLFALGAALGALITYVVNPSLTMVHEPWKFGLGQALLFLVAVLVWGPATRGKSLLPPIAIGMVGVFVLAEGARSLTGACLLSSAYLFLQIFFARQRARGVKFSILRTVFLFLVAGTVAMGIMRVYSEAAQQGLLGRSAREKYETQASGKFGLLLGGRAEIFVSSQAILDSPLIGHGSWAKDRKYTDLLLQLRSFGYDVDETRDLDGLIPTHSHLFGAWVESGIVGTLFWFWAIALCVRVLSGLFLLREPMSALIVSITSIFLWDILFSPFGLDRRLLAPFFIIVLLYARDVLLVPRGALSVPSRPARQARARTTDS